MASTDLSERAGFSVVLNGETLDFGADLMAPAPAVRRLKEMDDVLLEPARAADDPERGLYDMYRNVHLEADDREITQMGLRYDLTVIPPGRLGPEWVKTAGHYHPHPPGAPISYPEIYEVIHGTAYYLFQRAGEEPGTIEDVVLYEATAGDQVIVPPSYGHITINPGTEVLVMANWVEATFESIYEPVRRARGGAYYGLVESPHWQQNEHYKKVPELRRKEPVEVPTAGINQGTPMYRLWQEDPERFLFLIEPGSYDRLWRELGFKQIAEDCRAQA